MGFLTWLLVIVAIFWLLVGAVVFAPVFLAFYGIYFLLILIFRKINAVIFWRISHGRRL